MRERKGVRDLWKLLGLAVVASALGSSGCATAPMSTMQKRQITTHLVTARFDDAYRATLTVLQDEGYSIRETDMEAGFVAAHFTPRDRPAPSLEMSAVIVQLSRTRTEIRLTLVDVRPPEDRGWLGKLLGRSKEPDVVDPKHFQGFFRQIDAEVARRSAIRSTRAPSPAPVDADR